MLAFRYALGLRDFLKNRLSVLPKQWFLCFVSNLLFVLTISRGWGLGVGAGGRGNTLSYNSIHEIESANI